jgi:hypothetical protein
MSLYVPLSSNIIIFMSLCVPLSNDMSDCITFLIFVYLYVTLYNLYNDMSTYCWNSGSRLHCEPNSVHAFWLRTQKININKSHVLFLLSLHFVSFVPSFEFLVRVLRSCPSFLSVVGILRSYSSLVFFVVSFVRILRSFSLFVSFVRVLRSCSLFVFFASFVRVIRILRLCSYLAIVSSVSFVSFVSVIYFLYSSLQRLPKRRYFFHPMRVPLR